MEHARQHGGSLIFDSCCGVGESTIKLAKMFPESFVVGIDKSAVRIDSSKYYIQRVKNQKNNFVVVRGDVVDFWRLAAEAQINLSHHFLLYPNPWPKKKRLTQRWYAHPVFPALLKLGGILIVHSNWKLYLEEFALAVKIATGREGKIRQIEAETPLTPFEKKYRERGETLFELEVLLN